MQVDFIIVGAGIAGCSLGLEILASGKTFIVIDMQEKVTGSKVAAGLVNPIVPKGVKKTWNCDIIFPGIEPWYRKWEKLTGRRFFTSYPYVQLFANENMATEWKMRMNEPDMKEWVEAELSATESGIIDSYGHCLIKGCGRLEVSVFCESAIAHFRKVQTVRVESFDFEVLEHHEMGVKYKDISAGSIVFCEGIRVMENPFFNMLPFIPVAGDILELYIPGLSQEKIYKNGYWLIPIGESRFLAGSNYQPGIRDSRPVANDAAEILLQLKQWVNLEITLLVHRKGIRPTTQHRRPLLGRHREYRHIYLFNGLGSKGVSLCSWLAPLMKDFLTEGKELPAEVDVCRVA